MTKRLLIRGAKQLLTLRGRAGPRRGAEASELGIISDGAVLVENGRITHVGPARRIENLAEAKHAIEIDAYGHVVMPGFVDSHTHLVSGPPRLKDYELALAGATESEIRQAGGGLMATVRSVRNWTVRRLEEQARRTLHQMALHGTTTVEAKSGLGLDLNGEVKMLRAAMHWDSRPLEIYNTLHALYTSPPDYEDRPAVYLDWICAELIPFVTRRKLASFIGAGWEDNPFTLSEIRRYLETGRNFGLLPKLEAGAQGHAETVQLAIEVEAPAVDFKGPVEDAALQPLRAFDCVATLLPGSAFHLGTGDFPSARKILGGGAAVALATDYNTFSSPTCSMQMMLSLACSQMRMTPAEAIVAATINGAQAMSLSAETGSLEFGKLADILILSVSDYREIPFHFGVNQVETTIKGGDILQREREIEWAEDL